MIEVMVKKEAWESETLLNHDGIPVVIHIAGDDNRIDMDSYSDWVSIELHTYDSISLSVLNWLDSLGKSNYYLNTGG